MNEWKRRGGKREGGKGREREGGGVNSLHMQGIYCMHEERLGNILENCEKPAATRD